MYTVRIINNEAVLFENDIEVENLEKYRDKNDEIRHKISDGSHVLIWESNAIIWYDSDDKWHRDGDMPAFITTDGHMVYYKHDKLHREYGPASLNYVEGEEYYLDNIEYSYDEYIMKLNSSYGIIAKMIDIS